MSLTLPHQLLEIGSQCWFCRVSRRNSFFQNTCRKNLRTFPSKLEWTVVLLFQGGIWPLLAWGLVDDNFVDDVGDDDVDVNIISDKGRFLISAIS